MYFSRGIYSSKFKSKTGISLKYLSWKCKEKLQSKYKFKFILHLFEDNSKVSS